MSRFGNLATQYPDLARRFAELDRFLAEMQALRELTISADRFEPRGWFSVSEILARCGNFDRVYDMCIALHFAVRDGLIERRYRLLTPNVGEYSVETFAAVEEIPATLLDAAGTPYDARNAELVPVYSLAEAVAVA